jgi:hypothetical protein
VHGAAFVHGFYPDTVRLKRNALPEDVSVDMENHTSAPMRHALGLQIPLVELFSQIRYCGWSYPSSYGYGTPMSGLWQKTVDNPDLFCYSDCAMSGQI